MSSLNKLIIIFLFCLVVISILYLSFSISVPKYSENSPSKEPPIKEPICVYGEKKECVSDECSGFSYCKGEYWSDCVISKICTPGSKIKCQIGCDIGFNICNSCGTGYSNCVLE
ncbi:MAG: hypothetical protein PHU63_01475 [Candidatus ainarchaeum sp.]|nr:hypothetical protein [Candidatus ainarchaeum sp.]